MAENNDIQNPGSALGEAIGAILENEIHNVLKPLAEENNCIYISAGKKTATTPGYKLLLKDDDGNEYSIDAVITNNRLQPLILIESKYIRYVKHNRDKASWVCTAHTKLRERYSTVRKSIAVLMGRWSGSSKRLLMSFDVDLFEITFEEICDVLLKYGIIYKWAEKDREQAIQSWAKYLSLSARQKEQIGKDLISIVIEGLQATLATALDETLPRSLKSMKVQVYSTRGETKIFRFENLQQALEFLQTTDDEQLLNVSDGPAMLRKAGKGKNQPQLF